MVEFPTSGFKPNESPFEPAKTEETLPLLQSAIARKSRLQCWSPEQKYSYTSRIVKVNEVSGLVSISVSKEEPGGEEFEKAIVREGCEEILFSLNLPTDIIFFKAEFRRGESGTFTAKVKPPIFKVQRRRAVRLPIPATPEKKVKIQITPDNFSSFTLVNVSEGGIGIVVNDKSQFELISKNKKPIKASFEVGGILVSTEILARHGYEAGSTMSKKSYRIGFSFVELEVSIKDKLNRYIFEECSKFLGRF